MDENKEIGMLKAFAQSCLDFVIHNTKDKEDEKEVCNEDVDKRKLIDEVAGVMKSAGCDDEAIRTAIGKMEKIGYDKSEAKTADNEDEEEPKEKEEKEEKEDVENKCAKNSKDEDYMEKVANIAKEVKNDSAIMPEYETRQTKLKTAVDYFKM